MRRVYEHEAGDEIRVPRRQELRHPSSIGVSDKNERPIDIRLRQKLVELERYVMERARLRAPVAPTESSAVIANDFGEARDLRLNLRPAQR